MRFVLGHLGKGTSKKLHELVEQMELEKTIDDCQSMNGIATVQKVASFFCPAYSNLRHLPPSDRDLVENEIISLLTNEEEMCEESSQISVILPVISSQQENFIDKSDHEMEDNKVEETATWKTRRAPTTSQHDQQEKSSSEPEVAPYGTQAMFSLLGGGPNLDYKPITHSDRASPARHEINKYKNSFAHLNYFEHGEIAKFWASPETTREYPLLSVAARRYLTLLGSSSPSEGVFSFLGHLFGPRRRRTSLRLLKASCVLWSNFKQDRNLFINRNLISQLLSVASRQSPLMITKLELFCKFNLEGKAILSRNIVRETVKERVDSDLYEEEKKASSHSENILYSEMNQTDTEGKLDLEEVSGVIEKTEEYEMKKGIDPSKQRETAGSGRGKGRGKRKEAKAIAEGTKFRQGERARLGESATERQFAVSSRIEEEGSIQEKIRIQSPLKPRVLFNIETKFGNQSESCSDSMSESDLEEKEEDRGWCTDREYLGHDGFSIGSITAIEDWFLVEEQMLLDYLLGHREGESIDELSDEYPNLSSLIARRVSVFLKTIWSFNL